LNNFHQDKQFIGIGRKILLQVEDLCKLVGEDNSSCYPSSYNKMCIHYTLDKWILCLVFKQNIHFSSLTR